MIHAVLTKFPEESRVLIANDGVTRARSSFETSTIDDLDPAARIRNRPCRLQRSRDNGHRGPGSAEHRGEEFLA